MPRRFNVSSVSLKARLSLTLTIFVLSFVGCGGQGSGHKAVNKPGSQLKNANGQKVSYEMVRPIFESRCSSCHPGKSPPNWLKEDEAKAYVANGKLLLRAVKTKTMPLAGSPESQTITQVERDLIAQWVATVQEGPAAANTSVVPQENNTPTAAVANSWSVLESCFACHGASGASVSSDIPRLAGQSKEYLLLQLNQFQQGSRKDSSGIMNATVANLKDSEKDFIAQYFSQQRPNLGVEPSALTAEEMKLYKRGSELNTQLNCTTCHAQKNEIEAVTPNIPNVVFQKDGYVFRQLKAFRDGERTGSVMPILLKSAEPQVGDEDLKALAFYLNKYNLIGQ